MVPMMGFHSTMDSPESVRRVTPPSRIMPKITAAQTVNQRAIQRSLGSSTWLYIKRTPRVGFFSRRILTDSHAFFFNVPPTTEIYTNLNTLSLHDALPISGSIVVVFVTAIVIVTIGVDRPFCRRSEEHTSELQSHSEISYAVFCLKKKKKKEKKKNKKIKKKQTKTKQKKKRKTKK